MHVVPALEPSTAYFVVGASQLRITWALAKARYSGFSAFRCRSSCCWLCSGITSQDRAPQRGPRIFAGLSVGPQACLLFLRADLPGAQVQLRATARGQLARRQITSDFQKLCQARDLKIFRFRSHANQSHNSARLTADEGRWPSSRTRGEMRRTRELRLTCAAQTYGEVVWFGRRGAGVKSGRSESSLVATEAKEPFSGKSTK